MKDQDTVTVTLHTFQ